MSWLHPPTLVKTAAFKTTAMFPCERSVVIADLETVLATMLGLKLFSSSTNDD